jgi:hypothetical protein
MLMRRALVLTVLTAITHTALAAPDPEAAKQSRTQAQRLMQGVQSIREQHQAAAKANPQVQAALDTFATAKQAEADAANQLATAQEEGTAEKVETAKAALAKAAEASRGSWQSLQGTLAAVETRNQIKNVQGELERTRKQFDDLKEEAVQQALADYIKAGEAQLAALNRIAAGHEKANQDEVRAAGLEVAHAQTQMRDNGRVLHRHANAARIRREAKNMRDEAKRNRDQVANETNADIKAAAEALAKAREAEAENRDAIAEAQAAGKDDEVRRLQEAARPLGEATRMAGIVLEARNVARQRTPTPDWVENTKKNTPAGAHAELDAFIGKRAEAVAAWTKLGEIAAAQNPASPNNDQLEEARDRAYAADVWMNLADRRRYLAAEFVRYTDAAKQPGAEALAAKLEELRQTQEKLLESLKQQSELQVALRPLERKRNQIREQTDQAFQRVPRK